MTLPPIGEYPVLRIQTTPLKISKHIFEMYTQTSIALYLLSEEIETKLIWGTTKAFDEQASINRICTNYGIRITSTVTQVLRGTKLTIEIILIPNTNE